MGQEERKNKAKLEKAQIQLASNSAEYEAAVKVLEETTGRWNKEWKAACDVRSPSGDFADDTDLLRNFKISRKSGSTLQKAVSGLMRTLLPLFV